jgi:hypothetical protein
MTTSPQQIQAGFAKLRSLGFQPPRMAADGYELMVAAWVEKLGRYSPQAVRAAFDRWSESREDWPLPKHMLPMVEAEQAKLERGRALPQAPDRIAALNAALEAVLSQCPGRLLVRIDELRREDPEAKRQLINRLAEWALDGTGPRARSGIEAVEMLLAEFAPVEPALREAAE